MKKRSRSGPLFYFRLAPPNLESRSSEIDEGWVILLPAMPRALLALLISAGALVAVAAVAPEQKPDQKTAWPGSLRDGLPDKLPGYVTAPRDPFPDTDENAMGPYTQVSRRYQRIESSSAKVLVLLVQDYGNKTSLEPALRDASREAGKTPGIESREREIGGRKAFVLVNRTGANPVTIVTVLVTPARLLLAHGDNLEEEETVKLVAHVDFARIADAKPPSSP